MNICSKGDNKSNQINIEKDNRVVESEDKGQYQKTKKVYIKDYNDEDADITKRNVKCVYDGDDDFEPTEEEVVEKISQKDAEERFLLWYNDIQDREEWFRRRIKELEALEEKHKQTIATLKNNDKQLQQRYSKALVEISVLRKKNLSAPDDQAFLDSYTALSAEREKLLKTSNENNHIIKTMKKEMFMMRSRLNLNPAQNLTRRDASSQTEGDNLENYHTPKIKKDYNGTGVRHTKSLNEVKNFGGQWIRSKDILFSSDTYSSNQLYKNKRWEEVTVERDRHKRNGIKVNESVSLPDIRERPGHIMWRY